MHDLEYAVGIGCWLALTYLIAVYNFGNISPFLAVATPIIAISIVYIAIILLNTLVKILFWLLKIMFSPDILLFIVLIFLLGLFGFIIKETMVLLHTGQLEVD
jgi:hypothetical protein